MFNPCTTEHKKQCTSSLACHSLLSNSIWIKCLSTQIVLYGYIMYFKLNFGLSQNVGCNKKTLKYGYIYFSKQLIAVPIFGELNNCKKSNTNNKMDCTAVLTLLLNHLDKFNG